MTDEERALLSAVTTTPTCDTVRLVYADWLDENEQPDRAAFIRVQIDIASRNAGKGCRNCAMKTVRARAYDMAMGPQTCMPCGLLQQRERALLTGNWCKWFTEFGHRPTLCDNFPPPDDNASRGHFRHIKYSRGFVSHVICTSADWLANGDSLTWNPSQTMECPEPKPSSLYYQRPIHDTNCSGNCNGTGRIPRPCPSTAQPITNVTLTTRHEPLGIKQFAFWRIMEPDEPWRSQRWPGIEFTLPETPHVRDAMIRALANPPYSYSPDYLTGLSYSQLLDIAGGL